MKRISISPLAHQDLEALHSYLTTNLGIKTANKILTEIYNDMENLSEFPTMDVNMLARYDIVSDYLCLITHKNYLFYRIQSDCINIIRVLDERRDFLRTLFGIITTTDETKDY